MLPLPEDERFQQLTEDTFRFACHPDVPCFNQCCRRLKLMLTPYDVLRLKNRLGISASDFLERHADVETGQNGWPVAYLQMADNDEKTCPFVSPKGCTVYEDRPGACRTYPLGRAAKGGVSAGLLEEEYFLVREEHCRGFEQDKQWTPDEWTKDQGLEEYNRINDLFLPLITRQPPPGDPAVIQKKFNMFFMACYNLEAFGNFVLKSSLASRFNLPQDRLAAIAQDEVELLEFAFDWLAFAIFGEDALGLRQAALASQEQSPA
jgi:Fe-S-cluster containining protein